MAIFPFAPDQDVNPTKQRQKAVLHS